MDKIQINRILAFIIDMFLVSALSQILSSLLGIIFKPREYLVFGIAFIVSLKLNLIVYLLYFILFDLLNNGKTIGKTFFKNKVEFLGKKNPSTMDLITRTVLKVLAILFLPISVLLYLFNKQFTLQDYFAKTRVIEE